jgi:tetratricopeptide (TPR) repeat protein
MPSTDILSLLNTRFSLAHQKQIVLALHQDELVWNAVAANDNLATFHAKPWFQPSDWSPAHIAIAIISPELTLSALQDKVIIALPTQLRRDCIHAFENALIDKTSPSILAEAGMLALAFRERYRLTGSWQGIRDELVKGRENNEDGYQLFSRWKTVIAIAVGLIPDVAGFYSDLLGEGDIPGVKEMALNTILCQPEDEQVLASCIRELFITHMPGGILSALEYLERIGRKDVATGLARLVKNDTNQICRDMFSGSNVGPLSSFSDVLSNAVLASLAKFAGEKDKASELFVDIMKGLENTSSEVIYWFGKPSTLGESQEKCFQSKSMTSDEHPFEQLKELLQSGDSSQLFIDEVENAANLWLNVILISPWKAFPEHHDTEDIKPVFQKLTEVGLLKSAKELLEGLLANFPVRSDLWAILRDISMELGDLTAAIELAKSICLIEPEITDAFRKLAVITEKLDDSDLAYTAWSNVISNPEQTETHDYYSHGLQALKHNEPVVAIQSGEKLLSVKPDYGPGYYLLGEAFVLCGDKTRAIDLLTQATLLDEENPHAWTLLANQYTETDQPEKALAILKEAVMALPDNIAVIRLIGDEYIKSGAYVEGLPYIKKVVGLDPLDGKSAVQLGQILQKLGRDDEALEVLERGFSYASEYAPLTYELARLYLSNERPEKALPLLDQLSAREEAEYGWLVDFIECALGQAGTTPPFIHEKGVEVANIYNAIDKARRFIPENFQLDFYLACVLTISGENEKSLTIFQSLVSTKEFELPDWRWKVQSGIAINALALKQPETALVALEDVLALRPDESQMHRLLASVCVDLNLAKEGMQAARFVVDQSPLDAEALNWFTNMATRFGAYPDAVQATEKLIATHPDNPSHWYRLAQIHLLTGDFDLAKSSLSQFIAMKGAQHTQLMDAAAAFIQMRDIPKALMAYERIKELDCRNAIHDWDEALLYVELNDKERAHESLNQALDKGIRHPMVSIFRAGLLAAEGKYKDAASILNDVILGYSTLDNVPTLGGLVLSSGLNTPTWLIRMTKRDELLTQQIQYLYKASDYQNASQLAADAEKEFPDNQKLGFWNVLTRSACLQQITQYGLVDYPADTPADDEWVVNQLCTLVEHHMRLGETQEANHLLHKTAMVSALNPRVLAGQARSLAHERNSKSAEQVYQQALTARNRSGKTQYLRMGWEGVGNLAEDEENLWMGEALLDIRYWEDGLSRILDFYNSHPGEPRAKYSLVKAYLMYEEEKEVFQFLQANQHIPDIHKACGMTYARLNGLVDELGQWLGEGRTSELKARVNMIFQPSPIHLRNLAKYIDSSTAMKTYLLGLKRLGFKTGSVLLDGNYPMNKENAAYFALAYMDVDPKRAYQIIKPDLDELVEDPMALILFGMIARDCDNPNEAFQAFTKALQLWPDEPVWHFTAGKLADELGDRLAALAHFEDATHLDDMNPEYILAYAAELIQQLAYDRAINLLKRTWSNDEDAYIAYSLLTKSFIGMNDTEAAYQFAQKSLQVNQDSVDALLCCANLASVAGEQQQAMRYCREIIKIIPGHEDASMLLVTLIEKLEGKASALKTLDSLIPPVRQPAGILARKASMVLEVAGAKAALPYYQELVWKTDGNVEYLSKLAFIQMEIGDFNSAERTVTDALLLVANDDPGLNRMMAIICHKNGQLDRAVHHFSEAIRLDPVCVDAYLELAEIYKDRREYQDALHVYQRAMRVLPKDYRPYFQAGQVMKECKDYIGAEAMYRQAVELNPSDLQVKRQLGAIIALNLVHNCQEASVRA